MAEHKTGPKMMNTEDAQRFNAIAKTALAPVNPIVARQITDICGITEGIAIDIGSGPGHLAIEVAGRTGLRIFALDLSPAMHPIITENIRNAGLSERITPMTGDVTQLPCPDASADLVFSKGSAFFWDDLTAALREIQRVLQPGGKAFIGGGFGNAATLAAVRETMDTIDPTWHDSVKTRLGQETADRFRDALERAGIHDYEILHDPWQLWLCFRAEEAP